MVKAEQIEKGIATIRGYFPNPFIQYEKGYLLLEGADPKAMEEVDVEMMRQNKWIWENDFWIHVSYPKLKHWASCFIVHNLCLKNKEVINSTGFLFSFEEN